MQDTQGSEAYSIVPSRKLHKILTIPNNMTFQHIITQEVKKILIPSTTQGFQALTVIYKDRIPEPKMTDETRRLFCSEESATFLPQKKKQLALAMSKTKNIIKSEWKRKGPLVLSYALVMQRLYFSQFFTCFFWGLHQICSHSNVCLFIACKLCGW